MEEEILTDEQIIDDVLSALFPNATTEEKLENELDCMSWNND